MSAVAIVATIEIAPGAMASVLPLVLAHRERCLKDEPGTLMFEVMIVRDDPNKLMLYEVYRDQAAFDVHWNGASIGQLRNETDERMRITGGVWGAPAVVPVKAGG